MTPTSPPTTALSVPLRRATPATPARDVRFRFRTLIALVTVIALVAAACGSSWPTTPKPYIPAKVGDQKVETGGDVPGAFAKAMADTSKASAAGTVGKNCEGVEDFPELTLVALQAKDPKDTTDKSLEELMKSLAGESSVKSDTQTIEGVKAYTLRLNNDDPRSGLSLAVAHPPGTAIILYSVAYCGGLDKARSGMQAMLKAAQG